MSVLINWLLLFITILFANYYMQDHNGFSLAVAIVLGIWLLLRVVDDGVQESFLFGKKGGKAGNKSSTTSKSKPKQLEPYPMGGNYENSAIGAVDKCCEFAAYCIGSVIPMEICKPEPVKCFISANKKDKKISYGMSWTTNFYSLDSEIKEKGYYLGEGFSFSDNSGLVTYLGSIINDDKSFSYLIETPVSTLQNEFAQIAKGNFTGLPNHNATCTAVDHTDYREFSITIY